MDTVRQIMDNALTQLRLKTDCNKISLPVICEGPDGKMQLAMFGWTSMNKQRNVPRPEYYVTSPLFGGYTCEVKEIPADGLPNVFNNQCPPSWVLGKVYNLMDAVISKYLSGGSFPGCDYLYYLENMVNLYGKDFQRVFARLNDKHWMIDVLQEVA